MEAMAAISKGQKTIKIKRMDLEEKGRKYV